MSRLELKVLEERQILIPRQSMLVVLITKPTSVALTFYLCCKWVHVVYNPSVNLK